MTPQLCEAAQFPQILWSFAVGFTVGGFTGYRYRSSKESTMPGSTSTPPRWRALYERVAPALVSFCLVSVVVANVGVFIQGQANHAQDVRRTADNTRFIKCFDNFATDLSGSLPPVRKATQRRDAALSAVLGPKGLEGLLVKISRRDVRPRDITDLIRTFETLQAADRNLIKVRGENPYPAAPSKFCDLP